MSRFNTRPRPVSSASCKTSAVETVSSRSEIYSKPWCSLPLAKKYVDASEPLNRFKANPVIVVIALFRWVCSQSFWSVVCVYRACGRGSRRTGASRFDKNGFDCRRRAVFPGFTAGRAKGCFVGQLSLGWNSFNLKLNSKALNSDIPSGPVHTDSP